MSTVHGGDDLAPVIPLFPGVAGDGMPEVDVAPRWRSTWSESSHGGAYGDDDLFDEEYEDDGWEEPAPAADGLDECTAIERDLAEGLLVRRLRTRQLSVSEARAVLAERPLPGFVIDGLIDDFTRRGYLDDARLAEQLIHAGVERKGQGRRVVAQTLAKRGIPRDVADAALDELPDDDVERALEYARTKAPGMARLDPEVATRRLAGQLARRGYPGSVALTAAKQALSESGEPPGVRFR